MFKTGWGNWILGAWGVNENMLSLPDERFGLCESHEVMMIAFC